jgi:hypothetical protein
LCFANEIAAKPHQLGEKSDKCERRLRMQAAVSMRPAIGKEDLPFAGLATTYSPRS